MPNLMRNELRKGVNGEGGGVNRAAHKTVRKNVNQSEQHTYPQMTNTVHK